MRDAPVAPLNSHGGEITFVRLEGVDRPILCDNCPVQPVAGIYEAVAARFQAGFQLRPAPEEKWSVQMARKLPKVVTLWNGEELACNFQKILLFTHEFKIDADLGVGGNGNEEKISRVGKIKSEPAAEFAAQARLAASVVFVTYSGGLNPEISSQDFAQHPVYNHVSPPVAFHPETTASMKFVAAQEGVQPGVCSR